MLAEEAVKQSQSSLSANNTCHCLKASSHPLPQKLEPSNTYTPLITAQQMYCDESHETLHIHAQLHASTCKKGEQYTL